MPSKSGMEERMPESAVDALPGVTVIPCTPTIGAEIRGLDLSGPLDGITLSLIEDTLHTRGVVFFRGQTFTEAQQVAYSRNFGELEIHVLKQFTNPRYPEILVLSNIVENGQPVGLADAGQRWHSDAGYRKQPDRASVLYAKEIPVPHANGDSAGDTMFANAQVAYDRLDAAMKKRLEGLKVLYSYTRAYDRKRDENGLRPRMSAEQKSGIPDVVHPLVRTHPHTGRKCIYANPAHTVEIVGMPAQESEELLSRLYAQITSPDLIYRHKWQVGDVLMWDNAVVWHNAVGDYRLPQRRLMHTTRIKGTVPF